MTLVNIHEAKTRLSQLLARVAEGEEIVIVKSGNPCSWLPADSGPRRPPASSDRTLRIASPERTFAGAVGRIVSVVVNGYFAGQWKRFKECANDECLRVFYDDSRSGARRWCDGRCGDKIRTRKHLSAVRHGRR
jgi:antitoxin (DNA-binding transcriptional repressor) of toxin-antitoxin stability system